MRKQHRKIYEKYSMLYELDPDYPENNQFDMSKGHVSGCVLGAAFVVQCRCCDVAVVYIGAVVLARCRRQSENSC